MLLVGSHSQMVVCCFDTTSSLLVQMAVDAVAIWQFFKILCKKPNDLIQAALTARLVENVRQCASVTSTSHRRMALPKRRSDTALYVSIFTLEMPEMASAQRAHARARPLGCQILRTPDESTAQDGDFAPSLGSSTGGWRKTLPSEVLRLYNLRRKRYCGS